jgi:CBS domain containing-hemolysin-like protein
MEEFVPYLLEITGILVLVLLNGFFVASEFAMVRAHPTKLRSPEVAGAFGTSSAQHLLEHLDRSLSATQLGITIASLILGWLGEETFATIFTGMIVSVSHTGSTIIAHGLATALALTTVTILHVVLGELAAKSVAIQHPETTLRYIAPILVFFAGLLRPAIFLLNGAAGLFLSLFGLKMLSEAERVHTSGELSMLISQSTEHGVLDKAEEEMLKGIFGFSETVAREVMTPRTDLVTIPVESTFEEAINIVTQSGFSRFPVVEDGVDDVVGLLLARDLLRFAKDHFRDPSLMFNIKTLVRECYFVPGMKPIDDLLNELKHRKIHMAIVLDEHGGVDGAVTLEDLIEEIVGDIYDESDAPQSDLIVESNGDLLIDGGILVADLNERLAVKIPEGDYDTIAGFIFSTLGRMAQVSDLVRLNARGVVTFSPEGADAVAGQSDSSAEHATPFPEQSEELLLTVESTSGNRIDTVRIHRLHSASAKDAVARVARTA